MSIPPALAWRDEAPRLARLAAPAIVSQIGLVMMGVADVILVGALGPDALAAVGIGHAWGWGTVIVVLGAALGLDPLMAQGVGANRPRDVGRAFVQGTAFTLLLALPVAGAWWWTRPLLLALGQPEVLANGAADYCRAMVPGLPALVVFATTRQFLQAHGRMGAVTAVILVGNVINAVLAWALIGGHLGAPALGIAGAGLATSVVRWGMAAGLLWQAWRGLLATGAVLADARDLGAVARNTLPVGMQVGLEVWAFNVGSLLAGILGPTAAAAHTVGLNATSVSFMVALGLSQAGATRVGNLVGAGLSWKVTARVAIALTILGELPAALLFAVAPGIVARLYTDDPAVIAMAASIFPLAAAFQVFDGLQALLFGLLRGAGDTRVPGLANIVGYWLFGLPVGAWLALRGGMGLPGVWMGFLLSLGMVAALLALRLAIVARRASADAVVDCAAGAA